MGCFRVFAQTRESDFHGVNFELDTETRTLRLERDVDPSMRAYVTRVSSLVRLPPDHPHCDHTPDAYLRAVAVLGSAPEADHG